MKTIIKGLKLSVKTTTDEGGDPIVDVNITIDEMEAEATAEETAEQLQAGLEQMQNLFSAI